MVVQYTGHVIQSCQQTSRAHKNEKLFNLNINWDKPKFLRLLWDIVVFYIGCVFAEYDLFKPTIFIQNCIYMNLSIILTQFYINFSRQEH